MQVQTYVGKKTKNSYEIKKMLDAYHMILLPLQKKKNFQSFDLIFLCSATERK